MELAGLIVRILLIALTGALAGQGVNPELVEMLRYDPEVLAVLTGLVWFIWYRLAKWFGWKT